MRGEDANGNGNGRYFFSHLFNRDPAISTVCCVKQSAWSGSLVYSLLTIRNSSPLFCLSIFSSAQKCFASPLHYASATSS